MAAVGVIVHFGGSGNLVPLAAGITAGIVNLTIKVTSTFSIAGIATGTLMVIIAYHAVRPFARRLPDEPQPGGGADDLPTTLVRKAGKRCYRRRASRRRAVG
jgi:hypothetical protein